MPIPDFQTLMLPVLDVHADGKDWVRAPLRDVLAARFDLSADERAEMLPSGNQRRFDNRLAWTLTHLVQAGLLIRPVRGVTRITDRGRAVFAEHPDRVDMGILNEFEEYGRFRSAGSRPATDGQRLAATRDDTPEEAIEAAHQQLTAALADDLLDKMLQAEPDFFEQLVVDVLVAMGYGGSKADAGQRLGRSGDGGLDGVIREDRLGLDVIYVQAKRWDPSQQVSRPDVQAFAGALQGARASKGVFITTSTFSKPARDFADSLAVRLILVDGDELARLMIEHGVGVTVRQTYELKRVDEDYFATTIS
jgi:restriction system protein